MIIIIIIFHWINLIVKWNNIIMGKGKWFLIFHNIFVVTTPTFFSLKYFGFSKRNFLPHVCHLHRICILMQLPSTLFSHNWFSFNFYSCIYILFPLFFVPPSFFLFLLTPIFPRFILHECLLLTQKGSSKTLRPRSVIKKVFISVLVAYYQLDTHTHKIIFLSTFS